MSTAVYVVVRYEDDETVEEYVSLDEREARNVMQELVDDEDGEYVLQVRFMDDDGEELA